MTARLQGARDRAGDGRALSNLTCLVLLARDLPIVRFAEYRLACPSTAISDIGTTLPAAATGVPPIIQYRPYFLAPPDGWITRLPDEPVDRSLHRAVPTRLPSLSVNIWLT
jgi:hypothetical protein